jgi:hypothetical protein
LQVNAEFIEGFGSNRNVVTYISFLTPHPGTKLRRDGLRVLTNNLDRYNHKQPVAVPESLGRNGLELMVDTYHRLAETLGMREVNPRIDPAYLNELVTAQRIAA